MDLEIATFEIPRDFDKIFLLHNIIHKINHHRCQNISFLTNNCFQAIHTCKWAINDLINHNWCGVGFHTMRNVCMLYFCTRTTDIRRSTEKLTFFSLLRLIPLEEEEKNNHRTWRTNLQQGITVGKSYWLIYSLMQPQSRDKNMPSHWYRFVPISLHYPIGRFPKTWSRTFVRYNILLNYSLVVRIDWKYSLFDGIHLEIYKYEPI